MSLGCPILSCLYVDERLLLQRSRSGIVNVYRQEGDNRPHHLKALDNLTTAISTIRFNHDSQLLAIASKAKIDQMRMVNVVVCTRTSVSTYSVVLGALALAVCILELANIGNTTWPRYGH